MPGHDPLRGQGTAGQPLVVAHRGGQQLDAGTHARAGEAAQLVLRLAEPGVLEVEHHPQFRGGPDLVVAMQVAMHEHRRESARPRQDLIRPVAPAPDAALILPRDQRAEAFPQRRGGGQRIPRGYRADDGLGAPSHLVAVQGRQEPRELAGRVIWADLVHDREQACPGYPPGDQDQRAGPGGHYLGQVRDRRLDRERLQHPDLVQHEPCRGL